MKLTARVLFDGGGGSSVGMKAAGFELLSCYELKPFAVAISKSNGHPAVVRDLKTPLTGDLTCDAVWASPECQPYSRAGKRKAENDPRNLWPATWERIDEIRPTWMMAENVDTLATEYGYWNVVLEEARERFASVQWKILDAARMGLPQDRKRVILVCGPAPIIWPDLSHYRVVPASIVLGDGWVRSEHKGATGRPTSRPTPTVSTKGNLYFWTRNPGRRKPKDTCRVPEARRVTWSEFAKLQGFPDGYLFGSKSGDNYYVIGNAVPPIMAELVGRAVVEANTRWTNEQCYRTETEKIP